MHEFSIATQILESVLEFAEARQPGEVLKVRLEIGELMCVEAEQLRFCYDSIKQSTILEKSSLEIEPVSAIVKCPRCNYEGPPKYWEGVLSDSSIPTLQCPMCGRAAEAIRGHDCAIKSIQMRDRDIQDVAIEAGVPNQTEIQNERDSYVSAIRSES